ncbi:unnamed protein product [Phytophthora fragariaefolia]|uniref:Unnamed protein product n=1 Tax=Phytophthora fragariaefolia TaxID=1490495 RepID=A0A9W6XYA2_9STRA|nr:unnamed protein product [Phytophthora fragariaefolia]
MWSAHGTGSGRNLLPAGSRKDGDCGADLCFTLVGNAGVFGVKIDDSAQIWELKDVIKEKNPATITCDAKDLQLSLAKTADGKWLTQLDALQGVSDTSGYKHLQFTDAELRDVGLDSGDLGEVSRAEKAAGKDHVHVLVVVPDGAVGSASETSKLDQLIEKVDKMNDKLDKTMLGKRKVCHSSASSSLLDDLHVRLRASRALTEEQQRERYREYVEVNIGDAPAKNKLCVYSVEKGEDGKDILSADVPGHDIKLVGRTDMIILSDQVLENRLELEMLPDVRLIIEVKQKVERHSVSQAVSELIALDIRAAEPVMALLTDLQKYWQFFWVTDPTNNRGTIESVTICDPSKAFAVIKTLLASGAGAVASLPCFQEPIKRLKIYEFLASIGEGGGTSIRESIERYYDIASILGPDMDMARAVARQVTRSIPTLSYFS